MALEDRDWYGAEPGVVARRPMRALWRVVMWVVIVFALFVGILVVSAIVGDLKHTGKTTTVESVSLPASLRNTQDHPHPLGKFGGAYDGWRLRVTSVRPSAVALLGAIRQRVPAAGQEFMVRVVATYTGQGHTTLPALFKRTYVIGSHNVAYAPDSGDLNCATRFPPPPNAVRPLNENVTTVFPGTTVKGHLCFAIAKNDAKALVLYVDAPRCNTAKTRDTCTKQVWFALR
jgi:hypothetical protein